jgi:hypothetical protein
METNMRPRYVVPALSVVCIAAVALFWQRNIHTARAAQVAPYTAHLTRTENRVMPDGSSWNDVSTEVHARDRQGRTSVKTEHGSLIVQDPVKLETVTWSPNSPTAVVGHWPYWSGRKGCWADEHGQNQNSFPTDEDWHKIPASPGDGKAETIESIGDARSNKRIKTRFVSENLGQKEIHGLTAFGWRQTMTPLDDGGPSAMPETTIELWKSAELNLKLLEVTSGPKYGSERLELSDLQRGDPDPALFEPPQGYKVATVTYRQVPCEQQ